MGDDYQGDRLVTGGERNEKKSSSYGREFFLLVQQNATNRLKTSAISGKKLRGRLFYINNENRMQKGRWIPRNYSL